MLKKVIQYHSVIVIKKENILEKWLPNIAALKNPLKILSSLLFKIFQNMFWYVNVIEILIDSWVNNKFISIPFVIFNFSSETIL